MPRLFVLLLLLRLLAAPHAMAQTADAPPECPATMSGEAAGAALECTCTAEATGNTSTVWGTDIYTADSPICPAARHAGIITAQGGRVRTRMLGAQASYRPSTRNGVSTVEYGPYGPSFSVARGGVGLVACPASAQAYSGRAEVMTCACPAPAAGDVWGSDTYTADSNICRAAQHSGFITDGGGTVRLRMLPGQARYQGSSRNGVTTLTYATYDASFRFEGERIGQGPPTGPQACPDTLQSDMQRTEPLICSCAAEAVIGEGLFWGTDAYTADSRTCPAALHAGAVRRAGGLVTIRILGGLPRYVGTTRNGATSQNYGPYDASFRFEGVAANGPQLCPDNMTAYAGSREKLECLCTGEAVLRQGAVWGSNPYTADSRTCVAARHAGVAPLTGGLVRLAMLAGQSRYPSLNRNGIITSEYSDYPASYTFEGPQNVSAGAPVQAPVADSLRRTGRVSLYVTFRTNSADLDIAAAPVLTQVRDAMAADPALRLRLVGHTDSQGTPATNLPLSQRRAAAVAGWLASNGVAPARLLAEGRGQGQPIADNASEAGRSLNRRVEAERVD